MIHIFVFKKTSLYLEIPLKCLNEPKEICLKSLFGRFPLFNVSVPRQSWQRWQAETHSPVVHLWAGDPAPHHPEPQQSREEVRFRTPCVGMSHVQMQKAILRMPTRAPGRVFVA